MNLKPEEISSVIKEQIKNYENKIYKQKLFYYENQKLTIGASRIASPICGLRKGESCGE